MVKDGWTDQYKRIMDGFDRVDAESVQRLANDLLDNSALTLVMMGRVGATSFAPSDINV